jgi:phytoene dehydrogenase-like protein
MKSNDKTIIIIGAGFAGLSAGIYGQLNGYKTTILEMRDKPGGLCTSWNRRRYTFDGCIHWLVGSSKASGIHDIWEETGIAKDRQFINLDEYFRVEEKDGRTLIFYTDVDRLERHLIKFSPADEKPIKEFIEGIRICIPVEIPSKHDSPVQRLNKLLSIASTFLMNGRKMKKWMKITAEDFSKNFSDKTLAQAFREMWVPEFSMFFMLFTFAYLHKKNAGYPIGGSKPMSQALETRYKDLGGTIMYNRKVSKIIIENGKARGIRLQDSSEFFADRVISAADGHTTIFEMLGNRFGDESTLKPYEKWPVFPPLVYVSLGVNRTFDDEPKTVSGITFRLKEPVIICNKKREWLSVHVYNMDKTMAPEGKTAITLMLKTDYDYWKSLDHRQYRIMKEEIATQIIEQLEQRFPGIKGQIEVIDVATPLTFERYTGNWKGSFEGWLITPENSNVLIKPMSQTIPDLGNFYMCGQWVQPGGGLPTSIMSGKRLIRKICKEDGRKFRTDN